MTGIKCFLVAIAALFLSSCSQDTTREQLKKVSEQYDPARLVLQPGFNSYIQCAHTNDTEIGIITLKDGSSSKYWFRSHHLTNDDGGTWFEMSDGTKIYITGGFCCEVQLTKEQPQSLQDLKNILKTHDGISP
jgi:hypothetical protein